MTTIELPVEGFSAVKQYRQQPMYFFRYDGTETENETIVCSETTVSIKDATYESMVSALIAVKYDVDAQLALLYNYQSDAESYADAMTEYQEWRLYCKSSAKAFFGIEE